MVWDALFRDEEDEDEEDGGDWVDTFREDVVDWLASTVSRMFPEVGIEPYDATEWRPGLKLTLPSQCDHPLSEIEGQVFALRDRLFWEKDILVGLTIEREGGADVGQ